ncbi:Uncharacterised protein [Mycobacteroides abscessus subsp. abscessus]|nr:Uncharacterised protein [Mycobacteroides abscessus subsp. abscessus]
MRRSCPSLSIRHRSTASATSENSEKLVPTPSYVAPSGYGVPGQTGMGSGSGATSASACSGLSGGSDPGVDSDVRGGVAVVASAVCPTLWASVPGAGS